jgi:CMP-N,N'-diacetyllegionaminic acid synthase
MAVIALVPARKGSSGCPGKNLRKLGGRTLVGHACMVGQAIADRVVISADFTVEYAVNGEPPYDPQPFIRPADLAQDDTPMIAVVQHALQQIPGEPDDIIVLLQPTQPLRRPEHVQQAIALLRESGADSVVSVTEWPQQYSPEFVCHVMDGRLYAIQFGEEGFGCYDIAKQPARRQDAAGGYRRDGTVYAFKRATVERFRNIYGHDCRPLIIPPADTCELDTEDQWLDLERRWKERHGGA